MDNRNSELRKEIRALRFCIYVVEDTMRDEIVHEEDFSETAAELLTMRTALAQLRERVRLGDRELITVVEFFLPRRAPAKPRPVSTRPVKRHLVQRVA